MPDTDARIAALEDSVAILTVRATPSASARERLAGHVADATGALRAGEVCLAGYVLGAISGEAAGVAFVLERDGDERGAAAWRDVGRAAHRLACAVVA